MHLCITESSSCQPKTSPAGINSIPTENKHKFETKAEREEMLPLVATSGNSNWKTCVDGYFVVYQACRDLMKNHLSSINVLGWVLEKEFKREGRRSSGQSRYISFTRNFFFKSHEKPPHPAISPKCKSKLWGIASHWSKWPLSKSLQTINAGRFWRKGN